MRARAFLLALVWLCATRVAAATAEPRTLIDAALLPEGSAWNSPSATVLADVADVLVVDLGRSVRFRALLLQADGNDVYWIEASEDGQAWAVVWRVARAYSLPGLRTQTTTLREQSQGRFLRVRATTGDGAFSVARLRVYPEPPQAWPPALDESLPSGSLPLWPLLTPASISALQATVAVLGVFAAALALGRPRRAKAARVLLGVTAVLSAGAWINFGNFRYHDVAHVWEIYHYYVGAKYFPELGYEHLYDCSAVAEAEDGATAELPETRIRDLTTNQIVFAAVALQSPAACKSRFSAPRWTSFRSDVRFFRERLAGSWRQAQLDHGYNATPVWTLTGRAVASAVPATASGLGVLVSLDFVLLLLALVLIYAGFGFEAGSLGVVFFGCNALSRYAWTGGAFLRYDWFFWSVVGVWALRRERSFLGGFALTYAALLRVFPGALLAGLALQAVGARMRGGPRRPAVSWRGVALGGLLAALLLLPAAARASGGFEAFQAFAANSRKYLDTEADNRLGLATMLAYRHDRRQELTLDPLRPDSYAAWSASQTQTLSGRRGLLLALQAAGAFLIAWGSARHRPWVGAAAGACLLPIVFRMANYYYGLLTLCATLVVVSPGIGVGLSLLAWTSHIAAELWPSYDQRAVGLSVLAVSFAFATAWLLGRREAERDGEP